ncbi:HAMP domain-containing sensor histidine kinase [Sulfurimonas sp.]|uniref:sensor histidine kinase n=1 Tax=Sulfurimonas sp. TaxID=2022749 RepID=UPI002AB0B714|nr:HAMP domain-containing sensor histidine kinase [Sulfurimonas sp.]
MRLSSVYANVTTRQANVFTITIMFFFSTIFVGLLTAEMYEDYEIALEQSYIVDGNLLSQEDILEQKHKKLKTLMIKTVLVVVTLSFILFALFLGLNNLFNKLLNKDTQTFLDFFEQAAHNDQVINPDAIFFKDFKVMVGYANKMVEKINAQKYALQDMNTSLEDRVQTKTADLLRINKNLEEEKKFSQDLVKSHKEFLRYTVHETNTPLSVILTSIELYVMKHPKDRQLSKIEAAVKNIFNIYDDLSYLVKKDQIEYPKIVINFHDYISSRIDFFSEVAGHSRVEFNYITDAPDAHIYFNGTKLQRIVDNTITNAIKYTLPNEIVYVRLVQVGAYLDFSMSSKSKIIKDTSRVFDEYYQEEKTNSGFGIGLRLIRTICDEEKVEISLSSSDASTIFKYRFKMMGE